MKSKNHSCRVVTLKEKNWIPDGKWSGKGMILFAPSISCIQVYSDGKYYEITNPGLRGAVPSKSEKPEIFDIVCNPYGGELPEMVKLGYMNIIREKIANDLAVYEGLLETMGLNSEDNKIGIEDVIKHLSRKHPLQKKSINGLKKYDKH